MKDSNIKWAMDLDNLIYSIVRARCEKKIKEKYPDAKFTNETISDTPAKFPTIQIIAITQPKETDKDLEGVDINAVQLEIKISVMTNNSSKIANDVMSMVLNEFKKMQFSVMLPIPSKEGNITRSVAKASREVGSQDRF